MKCCPSRILAVAVAVVVSCFFSGKFRRNRSARSRACVAAAAVQLVASSKVTIVAVTAGAKEDQRAKGSPSGC